ncbi:hypothetical protein [Pseudokordiimonas caeni]|uniref:hypothetical protein n=1 Tax=Pseudokordiimonas caeni TaxID=2997908 RepID=UPI0028125DEA|nr:hypothetical protein [Pseudokordiimonas caeni]
MTANLFVEVKIAAQPRIRSLVQELLPRGRQSGNYWVARNPTRDDRKAGSFKISLQTGSWAEYATGEQGDLIALYGYLFGMQPLAAAKHIANRIGMAANDN